MRRLKKFFPADRIAQYICAAGIVPSLIDLIRTHHLHPLGAFAVGVNVGGIFYGFFIVRWMRRARFYKEQAEARFLLQIRVSNSLPALMKAEARHPENN